MFTDNDILIRNYRCYSTKFYEIKKKQFMEQKNPKSLINPTISLGLKFKLPTIAYSVNKMSLIFTWEWT